MCVLTSIEDPLLLCASSGAWNREIERALGVIVVTFCTLIPHFNLASCPVTSLQDLKVYATTFATPQIDRRHHHYKPGQPSAPPANVVILVDHCTQPLLRADFQPAQYPMTQEPVVR
jgi:hypothetical protein